MRNRPQYERKIKSQRLGVNRTCALFAGAVGALVSVAHADIIFSDDFQDGNYTGWTKTGSGSATTTYYAGNYSVRLRRQATLTQSVSTSGYSSVSVSASFAASSLEGSEQCIAEASGDGGASWVNVLTVSNGQDDGYTLYTGSASSPSFDNKTSLTIRGRAAANQHSDYCWLDDVEVEGTATSSGVRTVLTNADISGSGSFATAVDMSAFSPETDASTATNSFEGTLTLVGLSYSGGFTSVRDDYSYGSSSTIDVLPSFSFDFVQSGASFIPATRGSIAGAHASWEIILEPGEVWDEPGDNGMSRVALPFALQEKNANCTHNGMMTFAFDDAGSVTDVAYQIASETCLYFKFDMWALIDATYTPGTVAGASTLIAEHSADVSGRMPVKPISDLSTDYSGADPTQFGSSSEVSPAHMSAFGYIIDGTHYVGGCGTRHGDYPYCDVLDLPSYSTAKSVFGGVGLMRLEKLYPGVKSTNIASYVTSCASNGNWSDVSIEEALDMATGNYDSSGYEVDEASTDMTNFFLATTNAQKLSQACNQFPRKSTPGTLWVYHTSDTYLVGASMQAYYQSQLGFVDIWADLLGGIWSQIGLSQTNEVTRRTADVDAQPYVGWGLMYHRDDIAKIAEFLNVDDGKIGGVAQLDATLFDAAMQKTPSDRGLIAGSSTIRYNNGFWAWNVKSYLGCTNDTWVPFMSGYGGITIALMPNDTAYYYVSDNAEFSWGLALAESNSIQSLCN